MTSILPPVDAGSRMQGYENPRNEQCLYVVGSNNDIYQLTYKGGKNWKVSNITTSILDVPSAAAGSALSAFVTIDSYNNQQHVCFIDSKGHIHQLVHYDETDTWKCDDLTTRSGAPNCSPGSALAGYATRWDGGQHVNFIGTVNSVNNVCQLFYANGGWGWKNLTALSGAPSPKGTSLAGYTTAPIEGVYSAGLQHVNFIGADNHIYELRSVKADSSSNEWQFNDLTKKSSGTKTTAGASSALSGYATLWNQQQHVNFVDIDNHVFELVNYDINSQEWKSNDLTNSSLGEKTLAGTGSPLVGYGTSWDQQQHVLFIGEKNHVYQLVYTGEWLCADLTRDSMARIAPAIGSSLDGYWTFTEVSGAQQHVHFVGTDNIVYELLYTGTWTCIPLTGSN